jgi:hypothetical protein
MLEKEKQGRDRRGVDFRPLPPFLRKDLIPMELALDVTQGCDFEGLAGLKIER